LLKIQGYVNTLEDLPKRNRDYLIASGTGTGNTGKSDNAYKTKSG
jgi:hypothetical protein